MMAEIFAVAPTDRSYAPVASGISTAIPSMAVTDCPSATEYHVAPVRNVPGVQAPKTITKTAAR
jgi:hypothetical protein